MRRRALDDSSLGAGDGFPVGAQDLIRRLTQPLEDELRGAGCGLSDTVVELNPLDCHAGFRSSDLDRTPPQRGEQVQVGPLAHRVEQGTFNRNLAVPSRLEQWLIGAFSLVNGTARSQAIYDRRSSSLEKDWMKDWMGRPPCSRSQGGGLSAPSLGNPRVHRHSVTLCLPELPQKRESPWHPCQRRLNFDALATAKNLTPRRVSSPRSSSSSPCPGPSGGSCRP